MPLTVGQHISTFRPKNGVNIETLKWYLTFASFLDKRSNVHKVYLINCLYTGRYCNWSKKQNVEMKLRIFDHALLYQIEYKMLNSSWSKWNCEFIFWNFNFRQIVISAGKRTVEWTHLIKKNCPTMTNTII